MRAWLSLGASVGLSLLVFACATGTSNLGALLPDDEEGGTTVIPKTPAADASTAGPDAARVADSSVSPPKDSGTVAPVDSGTPTSSADCVGANSAQLATTYDEACDNFYFNSLGDSNPCTPGGNACAALNTPSLTFCCFKPPAGSYCADDYSGVPQCLPK